MNYISRWIAISIIPFLVSCTTTSSSIATNCPHVKTWTRPEESQMADELQKLPSDALLPAVMGDYAKMRAEARACLVESK